MVESSSMKYTFSKRIEQVPSSFLREIFEIIADTRIISFAAGLPSPKLFPVDAFTQSTKRVLAEHANEALQYGVTAGIPQLRQIIAESYQEKDNLKVTADQIIITNGSQQGLDLLGKVLIDEGDVIAVENPTYLAAIQAFSLFQPRFVGISLQKDGLDVAELSAVLKKDSPKILYTIPNFQNPTGSTYTNETRSAIAEEIKGTSTLLVEDDPYGEIRFEGERRTPFTFFSDQTVLLGSFSKIVAPGLRLGWMVVRDKELYEKILIAKQASDLHTSTFTQYVVHDYYTTSDTEAHVTTIAAQYKKQKESMICAIQKHLGDAVSYTNPEGGMFIWATFPEDVDTAELFKIAIEEGVAFVPGESFFTNNAPKNTMRLNFTNSTPEQIEEGFERLARALKRYRA